MSDSNSSARSGGIWFLGLLGILFIGLKLTGYVDWSWWLVLAPIYGGCGLSLVIFLGIAIVAIFAGSLGRRR